MNKYLSTTKPITACIWTNKSQDGCRNSARGPENLFQSSLYITEDGAILHVPPKAIRPKGSTYFSTVPIHIFLWKYIKTCDLSGDIRTPCPFLWTHLCSFKKSYLKLIYYNCNIYLCICYRTIPLLCNL